MWMMRTRTARVLLIAAGLMVVAAILPVGAGAGSQLTFSEARLEGRKHVDREHCPPFCYAADVSAAKRVGPQKIVMKGRSRYSTDGGVTKRRCDGRVIVKKSDSGRVRAHSRGWSCRTV